MAKKSIEVTCLKLVVMLVGVVVMVDGEGREGMGVPSHDTRDHCSAGHGLDKEEEWHYG